MAWIQIEYLVCQITVYAMIGIPIHYAMIGIPIHPLRQKVRDKEQILLFPIMSDMGRGPAVKLSI